MVDYNQLYEQLPSNQGTRGKRKPDNERLYPFTLCLTTEDRNRLKAAAKELGLTPATFARVAIRRLMDGKV